MSLIPKQDTTITLTPKQFVALDSFVQSANEDGELMDEVLTALNTTTSERKRRTLYRQSRFHQYEVLMDMLSTFVARIGGKDETKVQELAAFCPPTWENFVENYGDYLTSK